MPLSTARITSIGIYFRQTHDLIFFCQACHAVSNSINSSPGHDCSLSVATPTTLLPREQMQSLRPAPHRLGPPDRPGRKTSIAVFSLRGDAFPTVVSLLLVLAGDIELNPGLKRYTCRKAIRRGMDYLQCQANSCINWSHKQLRCSGFHRSQLTNSWRCPPHGGPGPPHSAPTTSSICDSYQQPTRAGNRPLTCATPNCPRLVHSARRCSGLSARQGR